MIKEKSKTWQLTSAYLGKSFAWLPFPAGFYTFMSLFLAFSAVILAYQHFYIGSITFFLIAGISDLIDGAVARARNKATHLGAFMDGTIDRFVDFALIYSYFFFNIQIVWLDLSQWICITSFAVIMPSFIVAYANHRKAVEDDNETLIWRLMNRGEMMFIMISIQLLSLFNPEWAGWLLILLNCLAVITVMQTIFATIFHSKQREILKS